MGNSDLTGSIVRVCILSTNLVAELSAVRLLHADTTDADDGTITVQFERLPSTLSYGTTDASHPGETGDSAGECFLFFFTCVFRVGLTEGFFCMHGYKACRRPF